MIAQRIRKMLSVEVGQANRNCKNMPSHVYDSSDLSLLNIWKYLYNKFQNQHKALIFVVLNKTNY